MKFRMTDLKLFSGLGKSYKVLSEFPFWISAMHDRSQMKEEFAVKAEKWIRDVSDKVDIVGQQDLGGISVIETTRQMEVTNMRERARFSRACSDSYKDASNLLLNESETYEEEQTLRKYDASFMEMLNLYRSFLEKVEGGQKAFERSMAKLERLVTDIEKTPSRFDKKKVKRAKKTARVRSVEYMELLKEASKQGVNISSLSNKYERVDIDIGEKRVKSFIGCLSGYMSDMAEHCPNGTRKVFKKAEQLVSGVDSEKLAKMLSDINKEIFRSPTYQKYEGTMDVEELIGYRPVVDPLVPDIKNNDVTSIIHHQNILTNLSTKVNAQSLDSYDQLQNPFYGEDDESGKENEEDDDKPLNPVDSYDRLHNPFCTNDHESGKEKQEKEEEEHKPLTPVDSYDRLQNPICINNVEQGVDKTDDAKLLTPANSYDRRFNPFCSNEDKPGEEKKEEEQLLAAVDSYDRIFNPFCSNGLEDSQTLENDPSKGEKLEQMTPAKDIGMVYRRKRSRITRRKKGGFIPSTCISPV